MDKSLQRAFAEGLIIGIGANLIADAISGHAREKGYSNTHIAAYGLLAFGIFLIFWTSDHLSD